MNTVVVNDDGNLIDAAYLCTILSLLHFRRPQVQGAKVFTEQEKRLVPLSVHHIPLSLTYIVVEKEQQTMLLLDPTLEEEAV